MGSNHRFAIVLLSLLVCPGVAVCAKTSTAQQSTVTVQTSTQSAPAADASANAQALESQSVQQTPKVEAAEQVKTSQTASDTATTVQSSDDKEQVTGAVQTTQTVQPQTPTTPDQYLSVASEQTTLARKISKNYQPMKIQITNHYDKHLQILQGEIVNSLSEQALAMEAVQSANRKKRVGSMLLRTVSALPVPIVGGAGSYAAYQAAAVAGSVANNAAYSLDASTADVPLKTTGTVVQMIENKIISPSETMTMTSIIPAGQKPTVKLVFKDLETNQIHTVFK